MPWIHTDTSSYSPYTWKSEPCFSHLTKNTNSHARSVYYFSTCPSPHSPSASLLQPTMCSVLPPPSNLPRSHDWRKQVTASERERKLSFHSIRLTAPRTVSICSLILSLFQLDPIWMRSLMCDAAKIFVHTGCQNHTEKETWACRDILTCTKTETHTHSHTQQMHPDRVSGPFVLLPLLQGELWWWGLIHNSSVLQQKRPCLSLRATQA